MDINTMLKNQFGELVSLREIEPNIFQIYAPFFHKDGDMVSMYLDVNDRNNFFIHDFGDTLMRVSYTFDIDSDNRQNVITNIVKSSFGEIDDGDIVLRSSPDRLPEAVFQYSQLVAKVSNIDILRRDVVRSLFYEYLSEFIADKLSRYNIRQNIAPSDDKTLVVDYEIHSSLPLYLFGVNDDSKASRVVISCLSFQKISLPFRSLIVHNDIDGLSKFNRNQLTNAADKQFTSLEKFKAEGEDYIGRIFAA